MLENNLIGFALFIGYFVIAGLPPLLLKAYFKTPFEITRKLYHLVIVLSIFPLVKLFSTWYAAVLAVIVFVLLIYPVLVLVEDSAFYKRIAVEREGGEFKRSLIIVQLSIATLIMIFWGLLGIEWQYVAVAAVIAWGFGDAAAALVGKAYGRIRIKHPHIEGAKTVEGTLAMYVVAAWLFFYAFGLCGTALDDQFCRCLTRRSGMLYCRVVLTPGDGYADRAIIDCLRDPTPDDVLVLPGGVRWVIFPKNRLPAGKRLC